jgi:hypothetical protein
MKKEKINYKYSVIQFLSGCLLFCIVWPVNLIWLFAFSIVYSIKVVQVNIVEPIYIDDKKKECDGLVKSWLIWKRG